MTDLVEFLRARLDEDEKQIGEDVQLGRHMWTEERLLAEVEAKRRIIEEHPPEGLGDYACQRCKGDDVWSYETRSDYPATVEFPCPTLRLLALPYADHPDFDQEWKL